MNFVRLEYCFGLEVPVNARASSLYVWVFRFCRFSSRYSELSPRVK
jgi:hypothetical protein